MASSPRCRRCGSRRHGGESPDRRCGPRSTRWVGLAVLAAGDGDV